MQLWLSVEEVQADTARMLEDLVRDAEAYRTSVECDEQLLPLQALTQDAAEGCDVPTLPVGRTHVHTGETCINTSQNQTGQILTQDSPV